MQLEHVVEVTALIKLKPGLAISRNPVRATSEHLGLPAAFHGHIGDLRPIGLLTGRRTQTTRTRDQQRDTTTLSAATQHLDIRSLNRLPEELHNPVRGIKMTRPLDVLPALKDRDSSCEPAARSGGFLFH